MAVVCLFMLQCTVDARLLYKQPYFVPLVMIRRTMLSVTQILRYVPKLETRLVPPARHGRIRAPAIVNTMAIN
jgi:hypothetical protein